MLFYVRNPFFSRVVLVVLLDFACVALAASVAWFWARPETPFVLFAAATLLAGAGAFLTLQATGAYDLMNLGDTRATHRAIVHAAALGLAVGAATSVIAPLSTGATQALASGALLCLPLLFAERFAYRAASAAMRKRIVIVGVGDLAFAVARAVDSRKGLGLEIAGMLSDDPQHQQRRIHGYDVLGALHSLEKVVREGEADWVVVASQSREDHFPAEQLLQLKLEGVPIVSGVLLYERIVGEIYHRTLRSSYLIFDDGFRVSRFRRFAKRSLDIVISSIGLVLTAPVLLLACLAIRIESRGPVFYRQTRLGRGYKPFQLVKLRSMSDRAEDGTGPVFASRGDPRITRVGAFLRKTRIDELPQLWQVLRGEMSIVGPRPERPEFAEEITERFPYFRLRSMHKPGITGWAQIRYGYAADIDAFEQKLALDLYYLKHPSVLMDLSIIWTTVRTILTMRGV